MRTGAILLCAFLVGATQAATQGCGLPAVPDGDKRLFDHAWIRSGAVFYGADATGVFKLRLGTNSIEPIGDHAARPPSHVRFSPKKRWLEYESPSPFEHWLYDIDHDRERRLEIPSANGVKPNFSPDETRLAWLERSGTGHRLAILDLNNFETRRLRLLDAPDPKAIFFDLAWSANGDKLSYAWRDAERQEFYSIDAASGVAKSIVAPREFGADEFAEGSYLLGTGVEPGTTETLRAGKDSIALAGGANVRFVNGKILLSIPGRRPRIVTEAPPGCDPSLALLDAFEGRYVLYRMNRVYWIYGVKENRKAILYRGTGILEW